MIGDLNESNILVSERALVTLVDLDSVQVRAGSKLYRCPVGKAEYTPPELQGRSFRAMTRQPSHDRYGLAVLVFLLLMEGIHPFAGVYRGEGEPPAIEANMAARRSPYLGNVLLAPMPTAPPFELLPRDLRELLRRAFKAPPSGGLRPSCGSVVWPGSRRRWQPATSPPATSMAPTSAAAPGAIVAIGSASTPTRTTDWPPPLRGVAHSPIPARRCPASAVRWRP